MRSTLIVAAIAMLALAAVACGGGDDTSDGDATPGVTPRPTSVDRAETGDRSLDGTLNTALAGNVIEMAALAGYQRRPCAVAPADASAPACREGEAAGTDVEVLPVAQCELAWVRPEALPQAFASALGDGPLRLAAVYKPAMPAGAPNAADAEYVAVIATGERSGRPGGVALAIRGGRIVSAETDCGGLPRLVAPERVASFIVEPRAGAETTATP